MDGLGESAASEYFPTVLHCSKIYFLLPKYFMTEPHGPSCNCDILSPFLQGKYLLNNTDAKY